MNPVLALGLHKSQSWLQNSTPLNVP